MKFIIIGLHSSGKQAIANDLRRLGVNVGRIFRSTETLKPSTYSLSEVVYCNDDINTLFETQSYIFMKQSTKNTVPYFEGLSSYEFENNDVFIMSPDQFNLVPEFPSNVCFVWLDNPQNTRRLTHTTENRKYDFMDQERVESSDLKDFTERVYLNDILYFNNEEPSRISAIVYTLVKYPELYDFFKERFNS